jgi:O-antigen/teichoic acid export membrane protein
MNMYWDAWLRRVRQVPKAFNLGEHVNWALADQAMVSGCNFLSNILTARLLGVDEFGVYVLAWLFVLFVQTIQNSAISNAMQSIGPKYDPPTDSVYYTSMFFQQALFGVATVALTWIAVKIAVFADSNWRLDAIALALAAAMFCCQTQDFCRRYLFSIGRTVPAFAFDAVRYVGQIFILLVMLYGRDIKPTSVAAVLWVSAGTAGVTSVLVIPFLPRFVWSGGTVRSIVVHNWHFSKWLIGSAILLWTIGNLFFVATGILLGTAAVGALRASQSLVGITNILTLGFENVIPRQASQRFVSGGRRDLAAYLKRVALFGGLVTAALAGVFAVAPEFWLAALFGQPFRTAGHLVYWWAVISEMSFLALPIYIWLRTVESTKTIFHAYGLSAIISTAIAVPLIKLFGTVGACIGILVGVSVVVITMLVEIREQTISTNRRSKAHRESPGDTWNLYARSTFLESVLSVDASGSAGAKYNALPSRRRARWVLPRTSIHRRGGLQMFRPYGVRGKVLKTLIDMGVWHGTPVGGAAEPLDRLSEIIRNGLGLGDIWLGLSIGHTGAYQKFTVRVMRSDGSAIAYAKIADRTPAKMKIIAEHATLVRLSNIFELNGRVPQPLLISQFADCLLMLTTPGPDRPGPFVFLSDHECFLSILFAATQVEKPLRESQIWGGISDMMDRLSNKASQAWLDRLNLVRAYVFRELGHSPLRLSLVHRDFIPWNTCQGARGLYVFDWEASIAEALPQLDIIHFHAMQSAVIGNTFLGDINSIEQATSRFADISKTSAIDFRTVYALYLLDIACYYLMARLEAPDVGTLKVLRWAEHQIDTLLGREAG